MERLESEQHDLETWKMISPRMCGGQRKKEAHMRESKAVIDVLKEVLGRKS